MFKIIVLGFLVFTVSSVTMPTYSYAISLDDDEEDAEDVADLLEQAKKAGESESFSKAETLLKKAKMYGVNTDDTQETAKYVAQKKKERDERLERERKERERLARLKREREERARQARLAAQREYNSGGYGRGGSISICVPSTPRPAEYSECTISGSGFYATVKLGRGGGMSSGNCFDLNIYHNGSIAVANTCGGVNGSWSYNVNGSSGFANGIAQTISQMVQRMR